MSPELLLNNDIFEVLWGKKCFMDKLINIVLDKAHVIKEWGSTFRTDYLKIGPIRYRFPRMIQFHLGLATVSKRLEPELVKNLHLHVNSLAVIRLSEVWSSVSLDLDLDLSGPGPEGPGQDLALIIFFFHTTKKNNRF